MYGLPDSVIATTTRKAVRMGRIKKRRYEIDEYQTGWGSIVAKWLDKKEAKRYQKSRRERLEKKHKVRFI